MTKEQRIQEVGRHFNSVTRKLNDLREMRVQYAYEKVKNIISPTTDVGTDIFLKYFLRDKPDAHRPIGYSRVSRRPSAQLLAGRQSPDPLPDSS